MHSQYTKEIDFNFINNANVYNVTTKTITRIFYICKHCFSMMRTCIFFFYTESKDTWFSIIYLKLDLESVVYK